MTRPYRPHWKGPNIRTSTEPDHAAVARLVAGERPAVTARVDRDAAIDVLDGYGLSAQEISARMGVSTRTVVRRRTARATERVPQLVN